MTEPKPEPTTSLNSEVLGLVERITDLLHDGQQDEADRLIEAYPHYHDLLQQVLPSIRVLNDFDAIRTESGGAGMGEKDSYLSIRGRLGDFQIIREIGRGGMGIVYEAEQLSIERRVALKVLPFAAMLDKRQIARFQIEARAAATLEHPNIVPVYFVGNERGVYYYAMRLIEGQNLADVMLEIRRSRTERSSVSSRSAASPTPTQSKNRRGRSIDTVEELAGIASTNIATDHSSRIDRYYKSIARIGQQAAGALDFAHAHGIIHRDIKPANIMLDDLGDVWITDFGLARIEKDGGVTATGGLVGTLRYMSPEQVADKEAIVDHRSDIYSLGATLYELLTLQPLFDDADRTHLMRRIAHDAPVLPTKIAPDIPYDLETIVLKSIQKAPEDRYATAAELADDLKRFLSHRPVNGRRTAMSRRFVMWGRRHPALVTATTIVLVALLACVASIGFLMARQERTERIRQEAAVKQIDNALREREEAHQLAASNLRRAVNQKRRADTAALEADRLRLLAESHADDLQQQLYAKDMRQAYEAWRNGWTDDVDDLLKKYQPSGTQRDHRGFEWQLLRDLVWQPPSIVLKGHDGAVYDLAVFENRSRLASVGEDGTIRIWDLGSNSEQFVLNAERIAKLREQQPGEILSKLRSRSNGRSGPVIGFRSLAVSPTGAKLATGNRVLSLWNIDDQSFIRDLTSFPTRIFGIAYSPNGEYIAAQSADEGVKLVRADGTLVRSEFTGKGSDRLSFSPDGSRLAVLYDDFQNGERTRNIRCWQLEDWDNPIDYPIDVGLRGVTFSSDGQFLLCGGFYGEILILDLSNGKVILRTPQQRSSTTDVAFSPDDNTVVAAHQDGTVAVVPLPDEWKRVKQTIRLAPRLVPRHEGATNAIRFVDQQRIVSAGSDGLILVSPIGTSRVKRSFSKSGLLNSSAYAANTKQLIVATNEGICRFHTDHAQHEIIDVWSDAHGKDNRGRTVSLTTNADGSLAGIGNEVGQIAVYDLTLDEVVGRIDQTDIRVSEIGDIAFSPDRQWMANGSRDHTVRVRSMADWSEVLRIRTRGWGTNVEFSPDGRWLAYADSDGQLAIIETGTWLKIAHVYTSSDFRRDTLRFSPDGQHLLTGHGDSIIRVWDCRTLNLRAKLKGHMRAILKLAIHPKGDTFASVSADKTVRLWKLSTLSLLGTLDSFEHAAWDCQFSPDGSDLLVISRGKGDGVCHVWQTSDKK